MPVKQKPKVVECCDCDIVTKQI